MSGHTPWRALRERVEAQRRARLASEPQPAEEWGKLHVIATVAGHRPSGLADAFGGYLCACQQSSWSHLASFGPFGGCAQGWFDARAFLSRYGVRDGAE